MVTCTNCGNGGVIPGKFCTKCGTKAAEETAAPPPASNSEAKKCPTCGKQTTSKFCTTCGTKTVEISTSTTSSNGSSDIKKPATTSGINSSGKKCPSCGTTGTSRFCTKCGTETIPNDGSSAPKQTTTTKSQPKDDIAKAKPKQQEKPTTKKEETNPEFVQFQLKKTGVTLDIEGSSMTAPVIPEKSPVAEKKPVAPSQNRVSVNQVSSPVVTPTVTVTKPADTNICSSCSNVLTTKFCTKCGTRNDQFVKRDSVATPPTLEKKETPKTVTRTPATTPATTTPTTTQPTMEFTNVKLKQTTKPPPATKTTSAPAKTPASKQTNKPLPPGPGDEKFRALEQENERLRRTLEDMKKKEINQGIEKQKLQKAAVNSKMNSSSGSGSDSSYSGLSKSSGYGSPASSSYPISQPAQPQVQSTNNLRPSKQSDPEKRAESPKEDVSPNTEKKDSNWQGSLRGMIHSMRNASIMMTPKGKDSSSSSRASEADDDMEEDDTPEGRERRKTVALDQPDPVRRSWKKKYDTLRKKEKRATTLSEKDEPVVVASQLTGASNATVLLPQSKKERAYNDPNLDPRTRIILEIVETEEDYISDLNTIIRVFLEPLEKSDIISKSEIISIFANLRLILNVNTQLNQAIAGTKSGKVIGEAFISMAEYLKMYSTYCCNQVNSLETINRLKEKNNKFETFLLYCFALPDCQNLDFGSFMIKPVQRICKYPLLLKELLNRTDASHAEHAVISEAFNKVTDIVTSINEKKRDAEAVQRVLDLSEQMSNTTDLPGGGLVTPTRKYIREGDVEYSYSGKIKEGHFFIFNDLFIVTQRRGSSKFSLKHAFPYDSSAIRYVSTYERPAFEIYLKSDANKPVALLFENDDIKMRLLEELEGHLDRFSTKRSTITGSTSSSNLLLVQNAKKTVAFECEYYDHRRLELSRPFTFDQLNYALTSLFEVEALTILHGETYITNDAELDDLLQANGDNHIDLALYDPVSPDNYSEYYDENPVY